MADTECTLCIGSNCGDREVNVKSALRWLSEILGDFRHSNIYATPDCHGGQREYKNAVCAGTTLLKPSDLDSLCKNYESTHGRDSLAREIGDVPVDIDIVVFGDKIMRQKDYASVFFQIGFRQLNNGTAE